MFDYKSLIHKIIRVFIVIIVLLIILGIIAYALLLRRSSLNAIQNLKRFDLKNCTSVPNPRGNQDIIMMDDSPVSSQVFPSRGNQPEGYVATKNTPDIVLKLYDSSGRMAGINYETGMYEDNISGVLSGVHYSGNIGMGGREWMAYPDDMDICGAIDITPLQKWAEEVDKPLPETITVKLSLLQWRTNGDDEDIRAESKPVDIVIKTKDPITIVQPSILLPLIEPTPPPGLVITYVRSSETATSAVIQWNTNKESDSVVRYGTKAAKYTLTKSDPTLTRKHSIAIENLTPSTNYYVIVSSTDSQGNTTYDPSQDKGFLIDTEPR